MRSRSCKHTDFDTASAEPKCCHSSNMTDAAAATLASVPEPDLEPRRCCWCSFGLLSFDVELARRGAGLDPQLQVRAADRWLCRQLVARRRRRAVSVEHGE